jgi:error-prone DNA polymerase
VTGIEPALGLLPMAIGREALPMLARPDEGAEIVADYRSLGLTLGRHPLALLRARLGADNHATARAVAQLPHGCSARVAGLVLVRQRPGSAGGVTFITLEDETGVVNLVVWRRVALRFRRVLLQATLLGAVGAVQREGEVVHLVVDALVDHSRRLGELTTATRDFR